MKVVSLLNRFHCLLWLWSDNLVQPCWLLIKIVETMNTLPSFTLFCPGPVNVSRRVAEAYANCSLSHREHHFVELLDDVRRSLVTVAGVNDEKDEYTALLITGSGTAANEAVLASGVLLTETVVVLSNGEFGERLGVISSIYNKTEIIDSEWGGELDLVKLATCLAKGNVAMVAMVHHETSTGLLNPIAEVGALCKNYGVRLFVDGVSSFAADPISMVDDGITFLTTSSGKAIAGYPGLSFVLGRRDSFAELAGNPEKNHYLNLYRYYRSLEQTGQTPNTPATSLVAAVRVALREILEEGMERRHKRFLRQALDMRFRLQERRLYHPRGKAESVVLTNVLLPGQIKFMELQDYLRSKNFLVYDTKGPLRGRYFQVSTMGDISGGDIDRFIDLFDEFIFSAKIL